MRTMRRPHLPMMRFGGRKAADDAILLASFVKHVPDSHTPRPTSSGTSPHEPPLRARLPRRSLLAGSLVLAAGGGSLLGCRRSETPDPEAEAPPRRDVPLRIEWVGSKAGAAAVRRAWGSVSSQPLDVTVHELSRERAAGVTAHLIEVAARRDVLVYPLAAIASLASADAIVPLGEDELESIEQTHGALLPALRHGAASYAGEVLSIPLGARLPALLSLDTAPVLESWAEYDRWVEQLDGAAGEPLAAGWAGAMFLWRAAAAVERGWLFDRESFEPLIDTEPYVAVLRQMRQTAERYRHRRQSPEAIWTQLVDGQLRGGIGFPAGGEEAGALHVAGLPASGDRRSLMLDPFSPVASLPAGCRQTAVAQRFLRWLAGGEGSGLLRREAAAMTVTRERTTAAEAGSASEPIAPADGRYTDWLRDQLASALTRPALQLLEAGAYYHALDTQVGRCLDGEANPEKALANVAEQWQKSTARIGRENQLRSWRRAQGMRAPG